MSQSEADTPAAQTNFIKRIKPSCLYEDDILVLTEQYWDAPKRIAHKMPLAWADAGNRVLWLEQPPFPIEDWRRPGQLLRSIRGDLQRKHERLWVGALPPALPTMHRGGLAGNLMRALHRPLLFRRVRRYITRLDLKPTLFVLMQQAARHDLVPLFPQTRTVYYCHDLFQYGLASEAALKEEAKCCRRVDNVWTTSDAHRQRLARHNRHTHHLPHAVDERWWDAHKDEHPEELDRIAAPRALFTGPYQTEKLDTELLIQVARRRPEINFVFVGPLSVRPSEQQLMDKAQREPNMHWLGQRRLEQLPGYIAAADVLLLPYRLDFENASLAGLGVKFYEYMISGRPVCATPYAPFETGASDLITIASGADDWVAALDRCIAERRDDGLAKRRVALARRNTYAQRIEQQRLILANKNLSQDTIRDLSATF